MWHNSSSNAMLPAYRTRGTLLAVVPGNSLARGAIPAAVLLSDDVSAAKCDNGVLWTADYHASPRFFHGFSNSVRIRIPVTSNCAWLFPCQNVHIGHIIFFSSGATAPSGPGPPHYRGFAITLRHTTFGRTPLDEWSARRRDLYLTTHNSRKRQTSMPQWDWNPQSQQASGCRPTP
jgi:hypothetical protein